jgi:epsilon-lactone hydrolase
MNDPVEQKPGVKLESRWAPFPASVSPEARAAMARMVGPDGAPLNALAPEPAIDDHEGWRAYKAAVAPHITSYYPDLTAEAPVESLQLEGVLVHVATPPGAVEGRVYLEIHGGALVHGDGEPCRRGASLSALRHGVRCYAVDYRMPPEHPYPAALDDCLAVYRALLQRYPPGGIAVGGGSAGANLAAALALRARDEGLPPPAALVLQTPEVDLTESGDSFQVNQHHDVVLPRPLMATNRLYAAGADLAHPYLSPLFGDFSKGFPPTFLQAGTRDLFLSNAVRMHRALRRAGMESELLICEGMPHGGFGGAPEDLEMVEEIRRFVAARWKA